MSNNVIPKDTLRQLLDELSKAKRLVGPVDTGKVIEFRETSAKDILMDDRVSYKSLKEYYFPQVEKLLTFKEDIAEENNEIISTVIFGAKPCDLEALRVMNEVFLKGKYADPLFKQHMDANLLIGVGCLDEKPGCFCAERGIDKSFSDYCDILLSDIGEAYTVEYLSDKGREILAKFDNTKNISCDNSRKSNPPNSERLEISSEVEDADLFDAIDWKKLTLACKGCGLCTYICPTCHCFDFKEVPEEDGFSRYRCWDSCIYPKFTLHASGHNPRGALYERYRQRVLHKYLYVKKNTGYTACTGCGRCLRSCPIGMNIKTVVEKLMEVEP